MRRSVQGDDFMTEKPVTLKPDTDLFHAIDVFLRHRISGCTVLDDNRNIVGVLSEMDCLKAIIDSTYHGTGVGGTVGEYMSKKVDVVPEHLDIIEVAQMLIDKNRRRIPIVADDGSFVGQISCRSILKAFKDFDVAKG
ncbi:MAG: CBS domain-containing protein [Pseudomonadales bacterium]|nr:CBS domain-containing protein [Pseudomonadales bacterium]